MFSIIGIASVLYFNVVRFNSWKEFGYALNIKSISPMSYAQRFGKRHTFDPNAAKSLNLF